MNLVNLDLNLLVSLNALLEEQGVTRAASRLGLSQPALSASLARLRRHFGDELLVRSGRGYELTPIGLHLRARSVVALAATERVFASQGAFDPTTSQRKFTLLASDYGMTVLGGPLCDLLHEQAPGVQVRLAMHTSEIIERGLDGLRAVDGLLLPHGFLTDLPHQDVFADHWVCLVAEDNPLVGDELTLEVLAELPWVLTYHTPAAFTPAAQQLRVLGLDPRVHAVVESFLALPYLVAGSRRVGLVQARIARGLGALSGIRTLPCPWDVVPLIEALWWHPVYDTDPEHLWLRSVLSQVTTRLEGVALPPQHAAPRAEPGLPLSITRANSW
ncbi:MAG TPA: LysR family transcriptional regulator [Mycobacteriales bacterium]|nr:LysR family transcriptional regulator [Mycobacteriales bacterium]